MSIQIENREEMIKHFSPKGKGIEVGVQKGIFSKFILENCRDLELYMLDCWDYQRSDYNDISNVNESEQANNMIEAIENVKNNFSRAKPIKGYSEEVSKYFPDSFFDFIYIDANHTYEAVLKDLNIWYPKLKNNGLFCGDDYSNLCGVLRAVNQFAKIKNIQLNVTGGHANWLFIKP
jgi:hypothetical protein